MPRTFGKLNERWILPDWLDTIPPERFPVLKTVVEQFSSILDTQIRRLSQGVDKRPDPIESAVGLSAQWPMSSLESLRSHQTSSNMVEGISTLGILKVNSHRKYPLKSDDLLIRPIK